MIRGIGLFFAGLLGAGACGCDRIVLDFSAPDDGPLGTGGQGDPPDPPPTQPLVVEGELDLSRDNTGDRTCDDGGDAVAYEVLASAGVSLTIDRSPAAGCLEPGDELLLIRVQGSQSDVEHVGKHELLRVQSVAGSTLTLVSAPLEIYGSPSEDGWETGAGRVLVQRLPSYTRLSVPMDAVLTGGDFTMGGSGVLAVRIIGDALLDGLVTMTGRGFRGGPERPEPLDHGMQGESIGGPGTTLTTENHGGGGGGLGDQEFGGCVQDGNAGGGGAHRDPGADANANDPCGGEGRGRGGVPYAQVGRMYLGAGGGSGGVDNVRVDNPPGAPGGSGGGIVWLLAQSVSGSGRIESDGSPGVGDEPGLECEAGGSTTACYDHSGPGGGGAGGSVRLTTSQFAGVTTSAQGGLGGNGFDTAGGNGGNGSPGVLWVP